MFRKIIIIILLNLAAGICLAQLRGPERKVKKNMGKGHWDKAKEQLIRALEKDSVNAAAEYLYSQFFFDKRNPEYHIDSAYFRAQRSLRSLSKTSAKDLDRLRKVPLDSNVVIQLRQRIDSAAFLRASIINTEAVFLHFLKRFPFANQREQAIILRDEAAFLDAVKGNTYEGFLNFFQKYPDAKRAEEARSKYHLLLYEAKTRSKSLEAFEQFLREYPSTPYRYVAEKNIYELSTSPGTKEEFLSYLRQYPGSSFANRARNTLFHLLSESDPILASRVLNDSLLHVASLNKDYLVPFLKDSKFGFMDSHGKEILPPIGSWISEAYRCGDITEDVLIVDHHLIGRDGTLVVKDSVDLFDDLGSGYIKVKIGDCIRLVHKSGSVVEPCASDGKILAGKFIGVKQYEKWKIRTFNGRELANYQWDDVSSIGDVVAGKTQTGYELITASALGLFVHQRPLFFLGKFDEVKPWTGNLIWVRKGTMEGILDQSLNEVVSVEEQQIRPAFFGGVGRTPRDIKVFSSKGKIIQTFKKAEIHEPWIAIEIDSTKRFFHPGLNTFAGDSYDSLAFAGPFALGIANDSIDVFLSPSKKFTFPKNTRVHFIPGRDSSAFLVVQSDRKNKTLYGYNGVKYFTIECDELQYAGDGFFIASKNERKGLISSRGKTVLPMEYDAIGTVANDAVSLLRNMKFGAFNVSLNKLIKPQYEKNLIIYSRTLIAAFQQGKYGFIGWDNKPLGKIMFDGIEPWSDSVALVRKGSSFALLNTATMRIEEDQISELDYIASDEVEKIAIVRQDNAFGVLSNQRGFVIPASFTALMNVGSVETPLYFTEKHVEEASIYVVIYYDAEGKMLLRQIYEEPDYEKIICPDN